MSGALDAAKGAFKASRQVINNPGIAQDNIIFAMLLFAFIVWITTKGELTLYLSFFKPGTAAGPATDPVTASSTTGNAQGGVSGAVSTEVNATGIGSAITKLTGVAPLSIGITPGSIASTIQGWFK